MSLEATKGLLLHEYDVNIAFSDGDLEEDICMDLPPRYEFGFSLKVYKLKKSTHGLTKVSSSLVWKILSSDEEVRLQSNYEVSYYSTISILKHTEACKIRIFLICVDDITVT